MILHNLYALECTSLLQVNNHILTKQQYFHNRTQISPFLHLNLSILLDSIPHNVSAYEIFVLLLLLIRLATVLCNFPFVCLPIVECSYICDNGVNTNNCIVFVFLLFPVKSLFQSHHIHSVSVCAEAPIQCSRGFMCVHSKRSRMGTLR